MSTLFAASFNQLWYMAPLIVSISLVYGATRHEVMGPILVNALRAGWWILSFMGAIFVVLMCLDWMV
jgi:hypothetical protein